MDREQARDYIRARGKEYLEPAEKAGYICPLCNSGSGKNGTGITTKDGIHFTCWTGCFSNADIIDIIGMERGITDYNDKLAAAADEYRIEIERGAGNVASMVKNRGAGAKAVQDHKENVAVSSFKDYYQKCAARITDTDYLTSRGISTYTAKRFWIGYDTNYTKGTGGKIWKAIIIPTGPSTYVARNTDTLADKADRYRKTGASSLFNVKALESGKPVFIVEGEIDAMSIVEAGGEAIGLGSTNNIGLLVEQLKTSRPEAPILLALDNDEAGKEAQRKLKDELIHLQLKCYDVDVSGGYKDANEFLIANKEAFVDAVKIAERIEKELIEQEKERYYDTFAGKHLARFMQHVRDSAMYKPIPTGFNHLDRILGGGLYAGLYVVGAVSSLGKTTFCIQLGDQVAEQGKDVLFFSLEMAEDELIARSISRETKKECIKRYGIAHTRYAKDTRDMLNSKTWEQTETDMEIIIAAMEKYEKYANRLKIIEGIGNVGVEQIREAVDRHVRITGKYPVVIVDYLQILAPLTERGTDKQNTDKAVLELKKLSRDFCLPVIVISSFNRQNYNDPVNMAAFKESGAVEYSSDVAIGLQYSYMEFKKGEKDKDRSERLEANSEANTNRGTNGLDQDILLKVMKNRNGSKGIVPISLYPKYNLYMEKPETKAADQSSEENNKWQNM